MTTLSGLSYPIVMGLLLGGLYALIALGLSLVFGVMKLINVAHGDLVVFGSYFAYAMMTILGVDPFLSLVVGMPLSFVNTLPFGTGGRVNFLCRQYFDLWELVNLAALISVRLAVLK